MQSRTKYEMLKKGQTNPVWKCATIGSRPLDDKVNTFTVCLTFLSLLIRLASCMRFSSRWCAAYVTDHWKLVFCKIRAHLHCGYHQITRHTLFWPLHRTRSTTSIASHYQSVQNIAALSTAPDQVYTSHRAVPTSQITQNIKNIDCRNIADMSQLGFITGLRTRAGKRVRVRVTPKSPAENPHPRGGFGGFLYLNKLNIKYTDYNKIY